MHHCDVEDNRLTGEGPSATDLPNFSWVIERQLAGMAMPRDRAMLAALAALGVRAVLSLTEEPLPAALLEQHGLHARHLPLADFTAPTVAQAMVAVEAINAFLSANEPVVVHCAAGMGRTGTILACYRVWQGAPAEEAIADIRARRPGSIETIEQEQAVTAYARSLRGLAAQKGA
jgi:atypical dual specificity phosphatase